MTPETIAIVKSCVPILQEHGEALTRLFYQRMFTHNPEVKPFFNPIHQQEGTQQRALATAVLAYAQHIDNPAALSSAISLIANKHASLMVKPEHYPIVGQNLLAALEELLGDAATPEILDAWGEAYGFLAEVFINAEKELYEQQEWNGFKDFTITKITQESSEVKSLHLKPVDPITFTHIPGQYITVRVPHPNTGTTMRNYSISSIPGDTLRISVKQESGDPDGWVSHQLHTLTQGDTLEVGPPCGDFTFTPNQHDSHPLVFVAGGIGITPLISMIHAAAKVQPSRPIHIVHAVRSNEARAFAADLQQLTNNNKNTTLHVFVENTSKADTRGENYHTQGRPSKEALAKLVPDNAEVYFCGPPEFMHVTTSALDIAKIPAKRRHHEFFGPAQGIS